MRPCTRTRKAAQALVMGCYGMGVGRLPACVIEANHDDGDYLADDRGPVPRASRGFGHLSRGEGRRGGSVERLRAEGIDVIYDDRNESAGVKFNDADLLGMPIRVTVSGRPQERRAEVAAPSLGARDRGLDALSDRLKAIIDSEIERILPGRNPDGRTYCKYMSGSEIGAPF